MKFAKAMKMGGLLVEAKNVDYEDYYGLGLVCPECNQVVFRNGGGQRVLSSSGKTFTVEPFFSHHKAVNSVQAQECEKRVKQYDKAEIERINSQARGQWLSLLHKYFWRSYSQGWSNNFFAQPKMFYENRFKIISNLKGEISSPASYLESELDALVTFFSLTEERDSYLNILEENYIKEKKDVCFIADKSQALEINENLQLLRQDNYQRYLQGLIFKEMLLFLTASNNRWLLTAMYVSEFIMSWTYGLEGKFSDREIKIKGQEFFSRTSDEKIRYICLRRILEKLYVIPWINEFEKYQEVQKSKRPKPVGFGQVNSRKKKRKKNKLSELLG